jgi:hypothetical protein
VVSGIESASDWIIGGNNGKRLRGYLSIFPFNQDIVAGAIPILVLWRQGTLVHCNASKFPDNARPIFLKGAKEIIVGHYFLKLVIIDRAKEMNAILILGKVPFMVLNCSNNVGTKALTVLLWCWHKEGATHKIIWVNNRHGRRTAFLPMVQRVNSNRVMARLDNWLNKHVIVEGIHTKVATVRIKCGADVQMVNDLAGVVPKDLKGHRMPNMIGNTNPATAFFA